MSTDAPATPATNTGGMLICGPPCTATVVERHCTACEAETRHVEQFRGMFYGSDYHCLTCRRTEQDGYLSDPATGDAADLAYWDRIAADPVPREVFDAAVDAEVKSYSLESTGSVARDLAAQIEVDRAWRDTRAAVRNHWAEVAARGSAACRSSTTRRSSPTSSSTPQ